MSFLDLERTPVKNRSPPYTSAQASDKLNPDYRMASPAWDGREEVASMPELVTCPVCGCGVQVADALLGRRVHCIGCRRPFIALAGRPASPPPRPEAPPAPRPPASPRLAWEDPREDERGPFCPGCGRRITWGDLSCPYCGEELEPEDETARWRRRQVELVRRDLEPHRGSLIVSLGNVSMILGGLSLCMFGLGAVVSVPVGVLAWMMANRDLELMRQGRMDPRGKAQTETGRTGAIAGIILGMIFAAFYGFVFLVR
jgi:hypothetical protein